MTWRCGGSPGRRSAITFAMSAVSPRFWGAHLIRNSRGCAPVPDRTERGGHADTDHERHRVPGICARIGITAVLHSWGSALPHHPHVHMIVPGGGLSPDGQRRISSRPAFLLPVRVLGRLFRRLFLTRLLALFDADRLVFQGQLAPLADRRAFLRYLSPVRSRRWVVYAKPPFAGPKAVLAYLSRYTHRVAISNRRLLAFDERGVTFRYKDYRRDTAHQQQVMMLDTDEFIRRFMLHVLPRGFHHIRHYGLLASSRRKVSLARARDLLNVIPTPAPEVPEAEPVTPPPCPCCGGPMVVIQIIPRWFKPRGPPQATDPARGSP